ncbi:hypothetical protein AU255_16815 [Methyloprofundus sedimenti]|uniref:Uncharacterized protein n=1 Tax=Methyloprofundus sedimenti TaxID=1420851 RepID=A0A1V8M2U8_9GAMM|nr:hypothetical protein [Methyloprofundus sedimenti]OQK15852.1 hypothetical protein AU255_16815 [Methyloprofundus sedimenti]
MATLIFHVIILTLVLGGCTPKHVTKEPSYYPTQKEIAAADYGSYPSNYKQIIRDFLQTRLKDPSSAEYRYIGEPKKHHSEGTSPKAIDYNYLVKVYINSKNSYGGYVGEHEYFFYIWNGEVDD